MAELTFDLTGTPIGDAYNKAKGNLATAGNANPDTETIAKNIQDESLLSPTVLSSSNGKTTLDNYTRDHANDMTSLTTTQKNDQINQENITKRLEESARKQGGLTAEEIGTLGGNVNDYNFVEKAGLYIPKTTEKADPYKAELDSMDKAFKEQEQFADTSTMNLMNSIKSTYESIMQDQRDANEKNYASVRNYGLRSGLSRYSGESFSTALGETATAGIKALSGIAAKQASALVEAQNALIEKKYTLFAKKREEIASLKKERADQLTKIAEAAQKEKEAQAKIKAELTKDINSVMTDARKNGAPDEVIQAIASSGSLSEAVKNSGDYLQGGAGIVGEYQFYKRDALARGLTPVNFDEYQTQDANRKIKIASANAGGLTPQENSTFLSVTTKYQADAVVNAAIKAGQMNALADQIIADPNSATNQLASLYLYVKNLDPESAVREGELSLANETQSYLTKFSNSLTRLSTGRVIAPEAAKELAQATKDLVKTWQSTAEKKTKLYKAQASGSSPNVGEAFNKYLKDSELFGTELADSQEEAKTTVDNYVKANPTEAEAVAKLSEKFSDDEIIEYLIANGKKVN
jgi:hypothetical protein